MAVTMASTVSVSNTHFSTRFPFSSNKIKTPSPSLSRLSTSFSSSSSSSTRLCIPQKLNNLLPRSSTAAEASAVEVEETEESPEVIADASEPPPVEVQIAASAADEPPKGEDVFAVVMIGSRQYIVFPGRFIYTQRLKGANVNDKIVLNKVLLVGTRSKAYIGQPVVTNAAVHAVVEEQGLDKKVIVFKYKKKKNYRRNIGHRQPNTRIKITGITGFEDFPAETMPEKNACIGSQRLLVLRIQVQR